MEISQGHFWVSLSDINLNQTMHDMKHLNINYIITI